MLNTSAELGFKGTLKNPIKPAAIKRGIMLGINETITIKVFLNKIPIIKLIIRKATIID